MEKTGSIERPQTQLMQKWESHKKLHGAKILGINAAPPGKSGAVELTLEDKDGHPFTVQVGLDWWVKHQPQIGGYYVVYQDGYQSFSPGDVFESGNSKVFVSHHTTILGNDLPDDLPLEQMKPGNLVFMPFTRRVHVAPEMASIAPTYYVKHPDGSFSMADPQPIVVQTVAGMPGAGVDIDRVHAGDRNEKAEPVEAERRQIPACRVPSFPDNPYPPKEKK